MLLDLKYTNPHLAHFANYSILNLCYSTSPVSSPDNVCTSLWS